MLQQLAQSPINFTNQNIGFLNNPWSRFLKNPGANLLKFPNNPNSYPFKYEDFHYEELIFSNQQSVVEKYLHNPSGCELAIKFIRIHYHQNHRRHQTAQNSDKLKKLQKEIETLQKEIETHQKVATYSEIVSFYGFCIFGDHILICMELMDMSLSDFYLSLHDAKIAISEEVLWHIIISVIKALKVCKENSVMHRDIKPLNILINSSGEIKLCDFGASRILDDSKANTFIGTVAYMPPERFTDGSVHYDFRSEIWSLGITILEFIVGKLPYVQNEEKMDNIILQNLIKEYKFSGDKILETYSEDLKSFIKSCLKPVSERPTLEMLFDMETYKRRENYLLPEELVKLVKRVLKSEKDIESSFGELPTPDPAAQEKEWHAYITKDLRNHLVGKLVKAAFPSPDPAAIHDQRIKDLISYARKVEKEMFEIASDREEYYHLLAEKIYKIQILLQEKRNRHLHKQSERGGDLDQGSGSSGMNISQPGSVQNGAAINTEIKQELVNTTASFHAGLLKRKAAQEEQGYSTVPTKKANVKTGVKPMETNQGASNADKPTTSAPLEPKRAPTKAVAKTENKIEDLPVEEKAFSIKELQDHLMPIWQNLNEMDEAIPFRVPVDPELLNISDYFTVVKKPMDLLTIRINLEKGVYTNPWEFCDDMWLMFDNAWLYNRKNSKVYKFCSKLAECFVDAINPVMRDMGYCCGKKLTFTPLALFCYGRPMCVIGRDQEYYLFESGSTQFGVTVSDKYIYCLKCFDNLPKEGINLSENPESPNMAPKSKFIKMKNDQIDPEPFESCKVCKRKWHRICANYNKKVFPEGFVCDTCRKEKSIPKPENKFNPLYDFPYLK